MNRFFSMLFRPLTSYTHWLHTRWPAGTVEKLPEVTENGTTALPGVFITGDLTGIPLLKFASDTGAKAVHEIQKELQSIQTSESSSGILDIAIVGGGVSGISAAIEAKKAGLKFQVFEASEAFFTVVNFPKAKPIYTYPSEMKLSGGLQFRANIKEALLEEMEQQKNAAGIELTSARIHRIERNQNELLLHAEGGGLPIRARRVILALGRSGNHRKLGCPGEELDKVYNRLYDPKDYSNQKVLVVGGGDSALETAIALAICGADVTLSYRNKEFSRPKQENIEKLRQLAIHPGAEVSIEKPSSERVTSAASPEMRGSHPTGKVQLLLGTQVKEIRSDSVLLAAEGGKEESIPNDVVFTMIGREAPFDFFRRSGIPIRGEWKTSTWIGFILFLLFCIFLYNWKANGALNKTFQENLWFPYNIPPFLKAIICIRYGTFHVYRNHDDQFSGSLLLLLAGILPLHCDIWNPTDSRRKTPIRDQANRMLMLIQVIPLFLLPFVILPFPVTTAGLIPALGNTWRTTFPGCEIRTGT